MFNCLVIFAFNNYLIVFFIQSTFNFTSRFSADGKEKAKTAGGYPAQE